MKVYIPSLRRADKQVTVRELAGVKRAEVIVVIGPEDEKAYRAHNPGVAMLVLPKNVKGIGKVRHYLLQRHADEHKDQRMVMMDDDLTFSTRRTDDPTKAAPATKQELGQMFIALEKCLETYWHGSILAREGANRFADHGILYSTRLLRVLAYRAADVLALGIRFDRLKVMEDFDVTLQLLRAGHPNFVLCEWWQNQKGSGLAGGCSVYRDMDVQTAGALGLKKLHPQFVDVVTKETKGAWGGGERTDVRIKWKKALESAK